MMDNDDPIPPEREDEVEERTALLLECPHWRWRGRKAARKEAEDEIGARLNNFEERSEG